ncbi:MAG: ribosomal protein modification protein RimK [Bacteroidetes bacterium]|nr:ribosomal protein modification protein RimK [Bacteroidota bacterium]
MQKEKQLIGRREVIAFPELGLFEITAKVDTGAYTTALHCHDIYEKDGTLHFKLLDPSHPDYNEQEQTFSEYTEKEIKNSFGEVEKRYIIKTIIKIGRKRIKSVISLTDRGNMRYPVLIGRKLLKNRFIVDVALLNHIPPSGRKKNKS